MLCEMFRHLDKEMRRKLRESMKTKQSTILCYVIVSQILNTSIGFARQQILQSLTFILRIPVKMSGNIFLQSSKERVFSNLR